MDSINISSLFTQRLQNIGDFVVVGIRENRFLKKVEAEFFG